MTAKDRIEKHKNLLTNYLKDFVHIAKQEDTPLATELMIDESKGIYLVLTYGWTAERFLHFVVFHFEIKADATIWLYQNRTTRIVLEELTDLGIAEEDIVLALVEPYPLELALAA